MNFGEKKMYERKLIVGKRKLFIQKKTVCHITSGPKQIQM